MFFTVICSLIIGINGYEYDYNQLNNNVIVESSGIVTAIPDRSSNQIEDIKVDSKKPVLVCVLDQKYIQQYYDILNELRTNGIQTEIYLDKNKNLKKQLQYADRKKI